MLFLVNDILDFSQIESRSFILNLEECNIQLMVEECIDLFNFKANEKHIKLHYTLFGGGRNES
jgi:signal transduction histidine kinase